jgi:hypothetical protein
MNSLNEIAVSTGLKVVADDIASYTLSCLPPPYLVIASRNQAQKTPHEECHDQAESNDRDDTSSHTAELRFLFQAQR